MAPVRATYVLAIVPFSVLSGGPRFGLELLLCSHNLDESRCHAASGNGDEEGKSSLTPSSSEEEKP
jgi:hypothetical protein